MNETEWILTAIFAFAVGYALAHFAKNIREIFTEWGFYSILLFPMIVIFLVFSAALMADLHSIVISLVFAAGFVIRMMRRGA